MSDHCIFCQILDGKAPAAWVLRDGPVVAFMDAFPFRPGHVLVIPRDHHPLVTQLNAETRAQIMEAAARIANAMRDLHPAGTDINWIINDGKAAWQHVPHVHLHLIPRNGHDNLPLLGQIVTRFMRKPKLAQLEKNAAALRTRLSLDK